MTRILQTDLARDALYTKVNQIADEKVNLEGDETITGAKTFTSNVKVSKATPLVDLYNTNITKGTIPSTLQYARNAMVDKDGKLIAMTQYQYNTAGETQAGIRAYSPNNETNYSQISIYYSPSGVAYTYAPRPTDTTTSSGTQIATTGWVNSGSNNVVHKSADETIGGVKTFTSNVVRANTDITKGTNPSNRQYCTVELTDKNGEGTKNRVGLLESAIKTNGDIETLIGAYKYENNSTTVEKISVIYPKTGNPYTYAPTPATSDNSTKIATTAFVKAQGYATSASLTNDYVNLTGEQTISGAKTFSKEINIKKSGPNVNLKNTGVTKGTNPSEEKQSTIYFDDKDGSTMGMIRHHVNSSGDTWMSLRSYPNVASQTTQDAGVYIRRYNDGTRFFYPTTASIVSLGKSDVRWKQIYCDTSTISTSDERLKQNIEDLPDEVFEAWGEVEFYRFKFKSSVSEKGLENARYHTGVVAQRIKSIFEKHNLNASDYGLFCYDEWDYEPEERDEKGDIISPERPAGNEYSIRYEECLCMEAAYQRWRADKIEERLRRLEERL